MILSSDSSTTTFQCSFSKISQVYVVDCLSCKSCREEILLTVPSIHSSYRKDRVDAADVAYAPSFAKKISDQEVLVGAQAKFVVKALGEPAPTAKW